MFSRVFLKGYIKKNETIKKKLKFRHLNGELAIVHDRKNEISGLYNKKNRQEYIQVLNGFLIESQSL